MLPHLLAAALLHTATPAARPPRPTPPNAATVVPLRRIGAGRLRAVRVRVGDDSLDFLLDTGNGTTLLARDLAPRVGCKPGGRMVGYRMTGEKLAGEDTCAGVRIEVGGVSAEVTAGLVDMAKLLDTPSPAVQGVVSLKAFAGRAVTLDLAHDRLVVETPASLVRRTRGMRELRARLATGMSGADLDLFVGVRARGIPLWLEWDSGHQAPTFLAPHAARLLGVPDSTTRADVALPLADDDTVVAPVVVKDVIYDGVLSAGLLERAVWTVDLARGRAWVGPVAPIAALPAPVPDATVPNVVAPAVDPVGVYETSATVQGRVQRAVLTIVRDGAALRGTVRGVGEENELALRDVTMQGAELRYVLPFRDPTPARVTFDGLTGVGTWGDPSGRGGALRIVKLR
jgi:hypothetical protein